MSKWKINQEHLFPKGDNPLGNSFYGYRKIDLELPDGRSATYSGVDVSDCVHVVALEEDETTYLVRQSRPNAMPVGGADIPQTWELPGGFADKSSLVESARSEVRQEIGKLAATLTKIGIILPSPGISNEHDHIYMGTDLRTVEETGLVEATEQDMQILSGKFGTLYERMASQTVPVSGQTLAAMAMVAIRLR